MVNPDRIFGRLGNRMFQMAYIYAQMRDGIIPDIYIQDYTLFDKYEKEIKEFFGGGIGFLDYVAIHVRRGGNPSNPNEPNYSQNSFYFNLDTIPYYEQAMGLFPNEKFLVFSDDVEFCKKKWGNDARFQIMERGDDTEDFNLMASCKGIIGANSSWSWWAGFLCPTPGAKRVFPSKEHWYSDGIERTTCPQSWIRL